MIDPDVSSEFYDRLALVAEGVAMDEGARMPGQNTQPAIEVEVADAVWSTITGLADG